MSCHSDFTYCAETALAGVDPARLREVMLAQAHEHGLDVVHGPGETLAVETVYGRYRVDLTAGRALASVASARSDWLFALKEGLTETVSALHPDVAENLRWSDALPEGSCPPNFQFIEVRSVEAVARDFLRITVQAEDLSAFGGDAIHFRLVLPSRGDRDPQWPRIAASGATIWPTGDKALHRPVYTVRYIDRARGEMVFDLFQHDGGAATQWARSVRMGARVGLTGPGGGGIPETRKIALYADETGLPAVARILEALPQEATGRAVLRACGGAECGYPLPSHPGVEICWRARGDAMDLADHAIAACERARGHTLWFAGEKAEAQKMRGWCKANQINLRDHYIAAFWAQGDRT